MSAVQDIVTRFQECIDAMATESGWKVQSDGKLRALYGRMKSGSLPVIGSAYRVICSTAFN